MRTIFGQQGFRLTEVRNAKELQNIINQYAELSVFEDLAKECKDNLSNLKGELKPTRTIVDQVWFEYQTKKEQWEFYKKTNLSFDRDRRKKLFKLNAQINALKVEQGELEFLSDKEIEKLENTTEEVEIDTDLSERRQELKKCRDNLYLYRGHRSALTSTSGALRKEIQSLQKCIDDPELKPDTTCPYCYNNITEDQVEEYKNGVRQQIEDKEQERAENKEKISEYTQEIKQLEEDMRGLEIQVDILEIHNINEITEYREQISQSKQAKFKYNLLQEQIDRLEQEKGKVEASFNNEWEKAIVARTNLKKTRPKITKAEAAKRWVESNIEQYSFWHDVFSFKGVQNYVVSTLLPELNKTVKYYADKVSGGLLYIKFITDPGKKRAIDSFKIIIKYGNSPSYFSSSGSEQNKINIAISLTFASIKPKHNLLFFDEIFDSLDETSLETVMQLLRELALDRNIFIITHDDYLVAEFPHELVMNKDETGVSNLIK
jgi:DNA repair exonuclease SbcCD ATPase subunit